MSLSKRFVMPYNENHNIQLRWEVFNAFNHANYDGSSSSLNTTIGQANTGQILATASPAREMQLALKVVF